MVDIARWTDWDGHGVDHCALSRLPHGFLLEGAIVTGRPVPFGAYYRVLTDPGWRTSEVRVAYIGGPDLHIISDGNGNWRDLDRDMPLDSLRGCLDVDIGITPATNTLPIRRLGLKTGEHTEILAAYIPPPEQIDSDFLPGATVQRYTCVEPDRSYLYEGLESGFRAEIQVDAHGLVLDYPPIFRRIAFDHA